MSTFQQNLDGESNENDHLTREPPSGSPSQLGADPERNEWYCKQCHRRVTVSGEHTESVAADNDDEYGHDIECKYSQSVEAKE